MFFQEQSVLLSTFQLSVQLHKVMNQLIKGTYGQTEALNFDGCRNNLQLKHYLRTDAEVEVHCTFFFL